MTHRPSEFTPIKTKQPLYENLYLEHYCAPVIQPNTREIIIKYANIANDPETREVWKQSVVNNLEASFKATIEQEQKVHIIYLYWAIKRSEISQLIDIGGRLPTTKIRPRHGPTHCGWKRNNLPRQYHYTYSRFNNVKNPVEQHTQHRPSKMDAYRYQKCLLLCTNGQVWVNDNEENGFNQACPTRI